MNSNENKTKCEIQKEFDSLIFNMLDIIDNIDNIKDGDYLKLCDLLVLLKNSKSHIINTPTFQTMTRRSVRNFGNQKYLSEIEKIYNNEYERCNRCSTMIKKKHMPIHNKTLKCCKNHEAKYQSIKIGNIKDNRIANRMIYASTFKFNINQAKNWKNLSVTQRNILLPNINNHIENNPQFLKTSLGDSLIQGNSLDWFKDDDGNWVENGKA